MMVENWPAKPEGSQWTDDQWKAVVAHGRDILVAAADEVPGKQQYSLNVSLKRLLMRRIR
ncbi:hypothetical protein ACUC2M_20410 [Bacillus cytotoxicus]